jgi:hypothetical protein
MYQTVGFVEKILPKQTSTGKTMYNIKLDDGNWYGHGMKPPIFQEGCQIQFTVEQNGQYLNFQRNGQVTILQGGNPQQGGFDGQQQQQQYGGQQYGGNGGQQFGGQPQQQQPMRRSSQPTQPNVQPPARTNSKDDYWTKKAEDDKSRQKVIEYQAARNSAIEVVGILLANDAVAIPAQKAKKLDAVLALVDTITDRFVEGTNAVLNPPAVNPYQQAKEEGFGDLEEPNDFHDEGIPYE